MISGLVGNKKEILRMSSSLSPTVGSSHQSQWEAEQVTSGRTRQVGGHLDTMDMVNSWTH